MAALDTADAAGYWLAAREALASAAPDDPLRAAGETNAGVAHLLLGQRHEADAALADAERIWAHLLRDVATSDVPLPARSSSFHFALASRNLTAFQGAQRRRHERQCEAGLAITRFNRLLAGTPPARGDAIVAVLITLLSDILGPRSPEVRLLRADAAGSAPYTDKAREIAGLLERSEEARDGFERLALAVALTVLLPPGLDPDASRNTQENPKILAE